MSPSLDEEPGTPGTDLSLSLLRDSIGDRIKVPARRMPEGVFGAGVVGVELNTACPSYNRGLVTQRWIYHALLHLLTTS